MCISVDTEVRVAC